MKKTFVIFFTLLNLMAANSWSLENKQNAIAEPTRKTKLPSKAHKPGAPVNLVSPSIIYINENEARKIDVILQSPIPSGFMQVEVSASDGLQLPTKTVQSFDLSKENKYVVSLELLSASKGRFYVNLHVRLNDGEKVLSRNLAVIIQVGPGEKAETTLRKTHENTSQEKIISMPAEEKVITK